MIIDWNFQNFSITHFSRQWHFFNSSLKSYADHSWPNITVTVSSRQLISRSRYEEINYRKGRCLGNQLQCSSLFQPKPFFSIGSAILPILMACSILSVITTRSVKCCAKLPTKYSKYGALKVLTNKLIISFSNKGGLTCAVASRHLQAYSLMDSSLSFSIACKLNRSGPTSILNLYCLVITHFWVLPNYIFFFSEKKTEIVPF